MSFTGTIALVTGAGSGLGRETAMFFAREAESVVWLSSPKSKFVYGVAVPVEGGFSIN